MEETLKYVLIFTLAPILIPLLFSFQNKTTTKALVVLLSIIVISSLVPLYPVEGKVNNLQSIFDFMFNGNKAFIVMLGAYLLSLILLAIPGHKLDKVSLGVYTIGYIASWVGFFSQSSADDYLVYPSSEYGNIVWLTSLIWL